MPDTPTTPLDRVRARHRGLIFDCDGTLADSMPVHWQAWTNTFAQRDWAEFPVYREYMTWGGISGEQVARRAAGEQVSDDQIADAVVAKQEHYLGLAPTIQPIEPVLAVARAYRGRLPMAVATGSRRRSVTQTLSTI